MASMVRCYCNLPECLAASGGVPTCVSKLGCYSEIHPKLPGFKPVTTTTSGPDASTLVRAPEEYIEGRLALAKNDGSHFYGCLDYLPV